MPRKRCWWSSPPKQLFDIFLICICCTLPKYQSNNYPCVQIDGACCPRCTAVAVTTEVTTQKTPVTAELTTIAASKTTQSSTVSKQDATESRASVPTASTTGVAVQTTTSTIGIESTSVELATTPASNESRKFSSCVKIK